MTAEHETRGAKRDSVLRAATIMIPGCDSALASRVRNVSTGGARIDAVDGLQSGMSIEIAIGGTAPIAATIAWIANGQCGVVFEAADSPSESPVFQSDPIPTAGWMADLRDRYRR